MKRFTSDRRPRREYKAACTRNYDKAQYYKADHFARLASWLVKMNSTTDCYLVLWLSGENSWALLYNNTVMGYFTNCEQAGRLGMLFVAIDLWRMFEEN